MRLVGAADQSIAKPVEVLLNSGTTVRVYDHNRLVRAGRAFGVQRAHPVGGVNIRGRVAVENC